MTQTTSDPDVVPNLIKVICQCGVQIGQHWCNQSWPQPEPTYTLEQVQAALYVAMGGTVPSWLWDGVKTGLEAVQ